MEQQETPERSAIFHTLIIYNTWHRDITQIRKLRPGSRNKSPLITHGRLGGVVLIFCFSTQSYFFHIRQSPQTVRDQCVDTWRKLTEKDLEMGYPCAIDPTMLCDYRNAQWRSAMNIYFCCKSLGRLPLLGSAGQCFTSGWHLMHLGQSGSSISEDGWLLVEEFQLFSIW